MEKRRLVLVIAMVLFVLTLTSFVQQLTNPDTALAYDGDRCAGCIIGDYCDIYYGPCWSDNFNGCVNMYGCNNGAACFNGVAHYCIYGYASCIGAYCY
jgi:hypothetical protein